jgi:hypothetical protein
VLSIPSWRASAWVSETIWRGILLSLATNKMTGEL